MNLKLIGNFYRLDYPLQRFTGQWWFEQSKGTVNFTKSYIKVINLKPYKHLRALFIHPLPLHWSTSPLNLDFVTPIFFDEKRISL